MPQDEACLAQRAQAALAELKRLADDRYAATRRVEEYFDNARRPHNLVIQALQERYEERAIELAAQKAPFSRSGRRLPPDELEVVDDGLMLSWHSDYDYRSHTVTWAELEKPEDSDDQL
ncbi:hypothetical protein P5X00_34545 [Paraburkholderia sp. A2RO-4L]|uniref:hypothetical protein n=1 Tax=Paraburkholderia sp. A2RO-4L TaxID=3028374 RepID=UPI0032FB2FA7|nr:hypothetical protein [Burkholderia vietnamiensis]